MAVYCPCDDRHLRHNCSSIHRPLVRGHPLSLLSLSLSLLFAFMSVLVWTGDHNKSIAERLRLTNTLAVDVLIDSNIYANAMTPNKHKRAGPLRRRRSLASHSANFHRLRTRAWPGSVDRTPSTCNHPQKRNTRRWLQVLHRCALPLRAAGCVAVWSR